MLKKVDRVLTVVAIVIASIAVFMFLVSSIHIYGYRFNRRTNAVQYTVAGNGLNYLVDGHFRYYVKNADKVHYSFKIEA